MPHQIKSKQVYGKWDGPWTADPLIWNQDNLSDSVYTTFVYWYKSSFCLQINAICFSFCNVPEPNKNPHVTPVHFQYGSEISCVTTVYLCTLLFLFQQDSYIGAFITLYHTVAKSRKLHKILQNFFYNVQKFISLIRSALTIQNWNS
jgi:hypothetical protein